MHLRIFCSYLIGILSWMISAAVCAPRLVGIAGSFPSLSCPCLLALPALVSLPPLYWKDRCNEVGVDPMMKGVEDM